jgi:hypothetical protein
MALAANRAPEQQPLQLTARPQILETPQRRDHLLTDLSASAAVLAQRPLGLSKINGLCHAPRLEL